MYFIFEYVCVHMYVCINICMRAYVCRYVYRHMNVCMNVYLFVCLFNVLFNDALNTFLINGYIGVQNLLIGKIYSGYLTGIDLRSTACQTGAYTTMLECMNICMQLE